MAVIFSAMRADTMNGGVGPLAEDGSVVNAHPWLQQLLDDVQLIAYHANGPPLLEAMRGFPLALFNELGDIFIALDLFAFRYA